MSRVGDKYKNNVWAFTYSPTHMAGLQVLFQAILNRNTLIFLFSATRKKFIEQCRLYSVTNVSATPTFYRLLAPFDFQLSSVTNVTLGGEKSTPNLIEAVKKVFPTARVHNIYASTEAGTLFVSHGENFKIAPELIDKVQIRNNEILLHKSILGEFHGDEWFSTGDMVEFLNENKDEFIILSRSDDFINIGGNRINLITVENELLSIPEIINARVFSKDNSIMGKVVAAEVVVSSGSLTKLQILKSLAQKLPSYMIPMSIDIVDVLSVTHSGKLRRTK
jgi:acyl-coenzyme A synthetase/AMP-(fatty) acid ligase